jgi:hypothetical protein
MKRHLSAQIALVGIDGAAGIVQAIVGYSLVQIAVAAIGHNQWWHLR